jgi:hypothetical protein
MSTTRITSIAAAAAQAGSLQKQVEAFIEKARTLADGGLTFAEAGQLGMAFIEMAVNAAEGMVDASGEDKLAAVLDAFTYLFDTIIGPSLSLPWYLAPFSFLLTPAVRTAAISLAEGLVEAAVARLNHKPAPAPAVATK